MGRNRRWRANEGRNRHLTPGLNAARAPLHRRGIRRCVWWYEARPAQRGRATFSRRIRGRSAAHLPPLRRREIIELGPFVKHGSFSPTRLSLARPTGQKIARKSSPIVLKRRLGDELNCNICEAVVIGLLGKSHVALGEVVPLGGLHQRTEFFDAPASTPAQCRPTRRYVI